jgi:hypothetical protein
MNRRTGSSKSTASKGWLCEVRRAVRVYLVRYVSYTFEDKTDRILSDPVFSVRRELMGETGRQQSSKGTERVG